MREQDRRTGGRPHRRWVAGTLAALLAGGAAAAAPAPGASAPAPAGTGSAPASTSAPGASTGPAPAPATATAPALRPAIQADTILSKFPGNASVVLARSDRHAFSVEGRVRDVRRVALDTAGNALADGAPGGKTELRVALVGRAQADDVPAHFACRFDAATEEAAAKLKPDQVVRLTGSIAKAVTAEDRFDLVNCHDLVETGPLTVGDQLVGFWRCNDVQVDGTALRKANQARGIKSEAIPDGNYTAPWHIDLVVRADGTLAAELAENDGPSIKRVTGRYFVLKDDPAEARLRLTVQGTQEVTVAFEDNRLKLSLPGLADKFVLPDMRFAKLESVPRPVDYRAFKDQTLQWFAANLARPDNNALTTVSDVIDQAAGRQQGFTFTLGMGAVRRGRVTVLLGACGKLMPIEYTEIEARVANVQPNSVGYGYLPNWGTLMAPEVKIDALTVDNRNAFDASQPLTGKLTLRGLRRMVDGQYLLAAVTANAISAVPIAKPGPDAQIYDVHINALPGISAGPRPVLFLIGRQGKPNDLFGDNATHILSDPVPVVLDVLPPR